MKWSWLVVALPLAMPLVSTADWVPADGHKMHFPQLPDLDGWDVFAVANFPDLNRQKMLADDWVCSSTGWVKDIHFWGSWKGGLTGQIASFNVTIWSNNPGLPGGYSHPELLLWERVLPPSNVLPIDPPTMQGWYDPNTGQFNYPDHSNFFQYNLFLNPPDWFWQDQGQVYWLGISANLVDPLNFEWGWKTADVDQYPAPFTGNHFMDDAVWVDLQPTFPPPPLAWQELFDPILPTKSLDLAFVITPEPTGLAVLLGLGVLALRRRR